MMHSDGTPEGLMYALGCVGALIGIGKLLDSDEPLTIRKVFGHGIVSGGLGGAASLILIPLPDVPLPVVVGCACALSSMGATTLTRLVNKYLNKR